VEEVIQKDKSTVSYSSATGWSRWLGKKHRTARKKAAKWPLGWGGKGGLAGGKGFIPVQSTGQPLLFTAAPGSGGR